MIINKVQIKKILSEKITIKILAWVIVTTLLSTIHFSQVFGRVWYHEGEIVRADIRAPKNLKFETNSNREETKRLRELARLSVQPVYAIDKMAIESSLAKVDRTFEQIRKLKNTADENLRTQYYKELQYLQPKEINQLEKQNPIVLNLLQDLARNIDLDLMINGISEKQSPEVLARIEKALAKNSFRGTLEKIILNALAQDMQIDEDQTQQRIDSAIGQIRPIYTQFSKGETIVNKGDKLSAAHLEILSKAGIYGFDINWWRILSVLLLNTVLCALVMYVFSKYGNKNLSLAIFAEGLLLLMAQFLMVYSPMYIPIIFMTMLLVIAMTEYTVVLVMMFKVSLLLVILQGQDNIYLFLNYFITAIFTAALATQVQDRNDITRYSVYSGLFSVLVNLFASYFSRTMILSEVVVNSVQLLVNSLFCSVLLHGFLPYFRLSFSLITPIKLLELSNPNHPLLKRLMVEAPGTYHHSLMVANLSELAVTELAGNGMIARVASYYHDIGKLSRPYFFIENQTGFNPHDKIGANLSATIIISHTTEGERIGLQYKLPQLFIDMIKQHHGNSVISYFYRQQLSRSEKSEQVNIEDFHYPGPLPQTREAAVVMLADSCEAAIRSLEKTSLSKVENIINKIIKEKLETKQLDDAPLTFKDLTIIKQSFIKTFEGMFHGRIKYQEVKK